MFQICCGPVSDLERRRAHNDVFVMTLTDCTLPYPDDCHEEKVFAPATADSPARKQGILQVASIGAILPFCLQVLFAVLVWRALRR